MDIGKKIKVVRPKVRVIRSYDNRLNVFFNTWKYIDRLIKWVIILRHK